MAVLIEAISVVVRRDAIATHFSGGWQGFLEIVPNGTLCFDNQLARVGFMTPADVESFVGELEEGGLTFEDNGQAIDIAVVDQMRGATNPSNWLEFTRLSPIGEKGDKVAVCWLFQGPRIGAGLHLPAKELTIATPDGWTFEDSLSANFKFVENVEMPEKFKFLRHESGTEVYLDCSTGEEVFVGRPNK